MYFTSFGQIISHDVNILSTNAFFQRFIYHAIIQTQMFSIGFHEKNHEFAIAQYFVCVLHLRWLSKSLAKVSVCRDFMRDISWPFLHINRIDQFVLCWTNVEKRMPK